MPEPRNQLAEMTLARFKSGGVLAVARAAHHYARDRYESWVDSRLDREYGTCTGGAIDYDLASLGARGKQLADATAFQAIQIPVFHAMMRAARIDPRTHLFIDFGCGKGRALLLAAQSGFKHVIGVEFASGLCATARHNVAVFRARQRRSPPIDVALRDAVDFKFPNDDAVLFFYNPFGAETLRKVIANAISSLVAHPRSLVIAYRNPVHREVIDALPIFRPITRNGSFAIYKSR
jgi:SAM-dependent methyltransferase